MDRNTLKYFKSLNLKGNALKDIIQDHQVNTWVAHRCIGFLVNYTGAGKTRTCIKAIKRYFAKYDGTFTVLVPTSDLQEQWNEVLALFAIEHVNVYVLKGYVESLVEGRYSKECTCLIIDELHRVCNEQSKYFSQAIEQTEFEMFLGVSATLDAEHIKFLGKYGIHELFNFSMEEGLELGLVPHYTLYNLACPLTIAEEEQYDYWNKLYNSKLAYFSTIDERNAFSLLMTCCKETNQKKAYYIDGINTWKTGIQWLAYVAKYWNKSVDEIKTSANIGRNAIAKRLSILSETESKLNITISLLELCKRNEKKVVVYTSTTKRGDLIAQLSNTHSLHSKTHKRSELVKNFKQGLINEVITNKVFDEGVDDELLEVAIAEHYTSVQRTFIQRCGRICRYSELKDKNPVYISLYSTSKSNPNKVFQDRMQLGRAQRGLSFIKYIKNLDEIEL